MVVETLLMICSLFFEGLAMPSKKFQFKKFF